MRNTQLIITVVLFLVLYLPLFPQLIKEWLSNPDYSHGFFIPLLSLYFLWRKKDELKNTAISPSGAGLLMVFSGLILYALALFGYQFFFQCVSMLIVLFGLVYAHGGKELAKKTAFSVFYLIFMIPPPQLIYTTVTFHLGLLATRLAFFLIKLFGVGATRQGNIINLPTCTLVVAAPCSGVRSLLTFMAASLAIGYIFQKDIKKRAILFVSSIALAVVMNTLRLFATGYIAHLQRLPEIPQNIHDTAGIVSIIVGFILLFLINDFLTKKK